jgi:DNA-binding transcriptional ArsR family regulator
MSQPQVSKHLRVLSEVGLVRCRAEGRRRLYRLEPARLRPLQEWLTKYERALNDRLHSAESGAFAATRWWSMTEHSVDHALTS